MERTNFEQGIWYFQWKDLLVYNVLLSLIFQEDKPMKIATAFTSGTLLKYKVSFLVLPVLLGLAATGCEKSTEPSSTGQISMTSQYSSSSAPALSVYQGYAVEGAVAVDSIRISRARFLLRDIKFKTQADSANFRSAPFVQELNLNGSIQDVSVASVPFGTYRRIEFDVHRIDSAEVNALPAADRAQFQEFITGDRYSIIINGTVYKTGAVAQTFTFKSRVSAKQKIDLSPELGVGQGSTSVNVTLLISSADWFRSGATLLDPTDPTNENNISSNLRASIRVFKDRDKDGKKDSN